MPSPKPLSGTWFVSPVRSSRKWDILICNAQTASLYRFRHIAYRQTLDETPVFPCICRDWIAYRHRVCMRKGIWKTLSRIWPKRRRKSERVRFSMNSKEVQLLLSIDCKKKSKKIIGECQKWEKLFLRLRFIH